MYAYQRPSDAKTMKIESISICIIVNGTLHRTLNQTAHCVMENNLTHFSTNIRLNPLNAYNSSYLAEQNNLQSLLNIVQKGDVVGFPREPGPDVMEQLRQKTKLGLAYLAK